MSQASKSRRFPLVPAYRFMESHGLADEADAIRRSKARLGSYNSTIRRGRVISALQKKNLLEEFIRTDWPAGQTKRGRHEIESCMRVYRRFLDQASERDDACKSEGGSSEPPRRTARDPFEILGIALDAESDVIAAAYRALARKYHPDVNRTLPSGEALYRMRELNWARDELERDLAGWRNIARVSRTEPAHFSRASPRPENTVVSQDFDAHMTLAEWLGGEGERILKRLVDEGGTGNFAIAADGEYYVQFMADRGGEGFYLEAVSNTYLPRAKRLSKDCIEALRDIGFDIDAQERSLFERVLGALGFRSGAYDGNFVLQHVADAASAARIGGTVLQGIYGVAPNSSLIVHVAFEGTIVFSAVKRPSA